jgi:hypothetical protein
MPEKKLTNPSGTNGVENGQSGPDIVQALSEFDTSLAERIGSLQAGLSPNGHYPPPTV